MRRVPYVFPTFLDLGIFLDLWTEAGWNGVTPVWCQELQLRREVLGEFGLRRLPYVLQKLNSLHYAPLVQEFDNNNRGDNMPE